MINTIQNDVERCDQNWYELGGTIGIYWGWNHACFITSQSYEQWTFTHEQLCAIVAELAVGRWPSSSLEETCGGGVAFRVGGAFAVALSRPAGPPWPFLIMELLGMISSLKQNCRCTEDRCECRRYLYHRDPPYWCLLDLTGSYWFVLVCTSSY